MKIIMRIIAKTKTRAGAVRGMSTFFAAYLKKNKVLGTRQIMGKSSNPALRRGLTLIELAVVMLVLGIIMAVVYGSLDVSGTTKSAKKLQVKAAATTLEANLSRYELENGDLSDGSKLSVLTEGTANWKGLKSDQVLDPWKKPYFICTDNAGTRHICSYGSDGVPGGKGESTDFYLTDESSWPGWLKKRK